MLWRRPWDGDADRARIAGRVARGKARSTIRGTTRVKVCCIGSVEEAVLAVASGADALGLVSEMPSGPGVISESRIAEIAARVPPPIATVLLTARTRADEIIAQQRRCRVNTIQLCDRLASGVRSRLRGALPGVALIQVVHICGEESVEEALRGAEAADALLLDSGEPSLPAKKLGGTGRVHDWSLSARIVEASPIPVFLAGGLTPENVGTAISAVQPFGVDLCTGVRSGGALDAAKLNRFMARVVEAPGALDGAKTR